MKRLRHGLKLDGVKLKPAQVSWQNEDQLRFVLREGRKRQIRRMCEMVGLTVDRPEARAQRQRAAGRGCRWASGATCGATRSSDRGARKARWEHRRDGSRKPARAVARIRRRARLGPVPFAQESRDGVVGGGGRAARSASSGSPRRRVAGSSPDAHAAASEEVADVLLYLIRLCDELGIDPIAAAQRKLVANAEKYPVDKARGNSKKYTEL